MAGPASSDWWVSKKAQRRHRDTPRGKAMRDQGQVQVDEPGSWWTPRTGSNAWVLGEGPRSDSCSEHPEDTNLLILQFWISGFQKCERLIFYCFKLPCLEFFVIAALGPSTEDLTPPPPHTNFSNYYFGSARLLVGTQFSQLTVFLFFKYLITLVLEFGKSLFLYLGKQSYRIW